MSSAKVHTLEQCCEIVSGATPKTSIEEFWDGDICWATPKDLSDLGSHYIDDTPRKITKNGLTSCSASVLPVGSVLFSSRAPIGHVAVNTVPMATNQGFKSFIPKAGVLDAKFLFHWLKKNRAFLESLGNGATFKEVSKATVARIEISLPPIADQRRIAAILDQADALRAKRREALAQLDSLTRSILIEMFGDPATASPKWPKIELDSVAELVTGYPFRSEDYVGLTEGIKLCRGANVLPGRLDWRDTACWPYARVSEVDAFKLQSGDIVMAMDRPWISEGFKLAQVATADCPLLLVQRVARIRPGSAIKNEYLFSVLSHSMFARHCKPTETTIPHISPKDIRSFAFPLPPLPLQREFAACVQSIETLKVTHNAALQELDRLFASLQHRAFQGEL